MISMETKELEITDSNDGSEGFDSKPLSKYMPKVLGKA